jgi:hypothetical protein
VINWTFSDLNQSYVMNLENAAPAVGFGPDQFGATPSPAIDFAVRIE